MAERPYGIKQRTHASIMAMDRRAYDPILELLNNRDRILRQIQYYEDWQSGAFVPMGKNGEPKQYFPKEHMLLFDKLTKIDEALLRYRYARVPETVTVKEEHTSPLVVNLTRKGEQYKINDVDVDDDESDGQD